MGILSEEQIKKELGVDSWRNISKDKIIRFAAMMPDMDKEVAIKIIEQFPEFVKFATETVNKIEEMYNSTVSSNNESQQSVHNAFKEIREILKGELNKESLSTEEKKYILELIVKTGEKEFQKDSENKKFLIDMFKIGAKGLGIALAGALVFVGGKLLLEKSDEQK